MPRHSLLLDTHVVIWMATDPERLPAPLLRAIETAEIRFVSNVSAWEIQIKHEKHGRQFNFSLDHLEQTMKAFSCTELPIEYRDIHGLNRIRFFHPDPFDRLLMSQAAHRRSVYLATLDQNIIRTFEIDKEFYIFTDRAKKE
ncbi:MAG TPA: type II toxin-antitoxin system VapC family toxin [Bryobacteraceae bacterium]|nr:type II toxin-antitoxin system VapC family toxin [Bryobacteraceae bacterium]